MKIFFLIIFMIVSAKADSNLNSIQNSTLIFSGDQHPRPDLGINLGHISL
jgi:hypothetical protein